MQSWGGWVEVVPATGNCCFPTTFSGVKGLKQEKEVELAAGREVGMVCFLVPSLVFILNWL